MADHPFADALFGLGPRRERLLASATGRILVVDPRSAALPDGEFDTVVSILALCSVPELPRTLRGLRDRLAPGGQLLFLEHVLMPGIRGRLQQAWAPAWSRMTSGCHLDRDPIVALRDAGFVVTDCERFSLPLGSAIVGAAVQGAARVSARAA